MKLDEIDLEYECFSGKSGGARNIEKKVIYHSLFDLLSDRDKDNIKKLCSLS